MNPYEPVTVPRYELEALRMRCAQLEEENIALEKASGLSTEQLICLFCEGYHLCPANGPAITKTVEANIIKELADHYHFDMQRAAEIFARLSPNQLRNYFWEQRRIWHLDVHMESKRKEM